MAEHYYLSDVINKTVLPHTVLSYFKPKLPAKKKSALKNGQILREAKLDLKGLKIELAREALCQFIFLQAKSHERCALITYDNETYQGAPPIIKNLLNQWLPQFKEVLAFYKAQEQDGGHGAIYVLLKKAADPDLPERIPPKKRSASFLAAETDDMERKRRLAEQQGERQLGPVKARDHSNQEVKNNLEGELQNNILQHPALNNQRFDGIDPNLNPEPPLNSEARKEFDNEKREQEKEKQLRLGNMPKFNSAPTPRGP